MKQISIQDLKASLSAAVAEAEAGSTIVITRHNGIAVQRASRPRSRTKPDPLGERGTLSAEHYRTCADRVEQDIGRFVLCDLTLDLCQSTTVPAVITPRSLDLAHFRTARWFHDAEKIDRFVTMGASQEAAARELGLPV